MSAAGAPQLPVHHMWGSTKFLHSLSVSPLRFLTSSSLFSCSLVSLPSRNEASESVPFPFSPELSRRSPSSPFEWGKWLSWWGERSCSDISHFLPSDQTCSTCLFVPVPEILFSSQPLLCHHVVIVSQLHLIHCLFNGGWITRSSSTALGRLDDELLQAAGTSDGQQKMTVDDCTFWGAGEQGSHSGQLALHGRSLLPMKQDGCGGLPKKVLAFPSP